MKIEIIIGSGIGLFAENDGRNEGGKKERVAAPDSRWQTILPSQQPPIKKLPSRMVKAGRQGRSGL